MKKLLKIFSILFLFIILLPGLFYWGLAIYYQDSFLYGTWFNGIYCTGKTVEEVQQELTENYTYPGLTLVRGEEKEQLDIDGLHLTYDFRPALEAYRGDQNPFMWYYGILTGHTDNRISPRIAFEEETLFSRLYETGFYQENVTPEPDSIEIIATGEGYQLREKKALILNSELVKEKIAKTIAEAGTQLDLAKEECYFTRDETVEMQQVREQFAGIEQLQQASLTYQIKEVQKKVTPYEISQWILTDEQGGIVWDKNGVPLMNQKALTDFVAGLSEDYDTFHNVSFTTHDGREILLEKGTYGTKIDQRAEVNFLKSWLKDPVETIREPKYLQDHTYKGQNLIDNTYVEVDMTEQKLYYFADKELVIETDVVTGCTNKGRGTPELACYVYSKSRNAILKGQGYRSPVDYWMPVYGGIGIHDASWRKEFGGDIYIKDGSHGCINTPLEKVSQLYELAEIGTPVVIHN